MHRSLSIALPPEETDDLVEELQRFGEQVVSISVQRGASVKPPGDVVSVHLLNRVASPVLEVVERRRADGAVSVASAQVDSISDPDHDEALTADIDDAPWDDIRAQLRHHSQLSANFVSLMALGGVIAGCGLIATSATTQAVAFIAAAIVAPAFEPLAKVPLGVVLRQRDVLWRGLRSALLGYAVVAAAGAVTMLALGAAGADMSSRFLTNRQVGELADPPTVNLVISAGGALAGALIITAFRLPLLPGPIAALHLIPAAAMVGMAAALGEGGLAAEALGRLGVDVVFIVIAGLLVFGLKQRLVHRRGAV